MDEQELAKRAVGRHLVSEQQLREAQSYAEGGRSLLSVLLDLGYLRPQDLADLTGPASRPAPAAARRRGGFGILSVAMASGTLGVLLGRGCALDHPPSVPPIKIVESPSRVPPPLPFAHQLWARAADLIAGAEQRLAKPGSDPTEAETDLRLAAALLEQAVREKTPAEPAFISNALCGQGHARELLKEWDLAFEAYRRAALTNPGEPRGYLGAARTALNLSDYDAAFKYADIVYRTFRGHASEGLFLRAQALDGQRKKDAARRDLDELKRDPSWRAKAEELLKKIQ